MTAVLDRTHETVVLHVGNQYRGSEKLVLDKALRSQAGVIDVDANPAAQTATGAYDPVGRSDRVRVLAWRSREHGGRHQPAARVKNAA